MRGVTRRAGGSLPPSPNLFGCGASWSVPPASPPILLGLEGNGEGRGGDVEGQGEVAGRVCRSWGLV